MSSCIGKNITVSLFGQSHSAAVGVVVDGLPAGIRIDKERLQAFLDRRAPGRTPWSTPRKESDAPEFVSGIVDGMTCGAPVAALIRNTNTRSSDYDELRFVPRPGHADYVADVKYGGHQDVAGGGHFSARLMAPLCIAGGIAIQVLEDEGIHVGGHIARIAGIDDAAFPRQGLLPEALHEPAGKPLPVIDDAAGARMIDAILEARRLCDSVGGIVECAAIGLPIGVGEPLFEGIESAMARILFAIPAVKGVEFGCGFHAADMRGSEHNDPYRMVDGQVGIIKNDAGGILGGISTGKPVIMRVAFKPTSSIAAVQQSVNLRTGENADLTVRGRHDPCVAARAVPIVEAACACVLLDLVMERRMR